MIAFLLIVLTGCITYLITDYRRQEEIKFIKAHYESEMDRISEWSFRNGMSNGMQRVRSGNVPMHTKN